MGRMTFIETPLAGLFEVRTQGVGDDRGSFERLFCDEEFAAIRPGIHWKQINHSRTTDAGTIRGFHFQRPPYAEAKLIRCMRGGVFDVAVDVRIASPTYLQWHAIELTEDNDCMFFIPEGFAHGFQTLRPHSELIYMHSAPWAPHHEGQLRFDDVTVGVTWPLPVELVSPRDMGAPFADDAFVGVHA